MSERTELVCRLMVELGSEFERLADVTTRQQRPEDLDLSQLRQIQIDARNAAALAESACLIALVGDNRLDF